MVTDRVCAAPPIGGAHLGEHASDHAADPGTPPEVERVRGVVSTSGSNAWAGKLRLWPAAYVPRHVCATGEGSVR